MQYQPLISFLMPAHNEEKVIHHALDNLQNIAGPKVEVLVGLDGCTDDTKAVVQRYPFAKIVELNERGGKPAVLERLMSLAKGEIFIVHDADWKFIADEQGVETIISGFEDPKLGGIILPPHNIPFWDIRAAITSKGFVGAGLGVLLLWEYLLATQTKKSASGIYADSERIIYPFTINIFRRDVIPPAITAADDFERFMYLIEAGQRVKIFNDKQLPYFQIVDQTLTFRDHLRQRIKNHIARVQFAGMVKYHATPRNFHLPFAWYCLKQITRLGWGDFLLVLTWYATILLAFFRARLILRKEIPDAKEAWAYRLTRHGPN